jgi:uncharacterized protein
LVDLGSVATLRGSLELTQYTKGALVINLPEGVYYDLTLSNTGTGVLLSGSIVAKALTDCTRCTDETQIDIQASVEGYYIIDRKYHEIAEENDNSVIVSENGKVDLAEPIIAALVYEIPFVVLCKENCAGLCDKCFANLNYEECTCKDEPDPDHPLAALRTLFDES